MGASDAESLIEEVLPGDPASDAESLIEEVLSGAQSDAESLIEEVLSNKNASDAERLVEEVLIEEVVTADKACVVEAEVVNEENVLVECENNPIVVAESFENIAAEDANSEESHVLETASEEIEKSNDDDEKSPEEEEDFELPVTQIQNKAEDAEYRKEGEEEDAEANGEGEEEE